MPRLAEPRRAVAGIELSNPERVLYPEQGITKAELAAYYEAVAPSLLPHVARRPLVLLRCPAGRQRTCFYQKHWTSFVPPGVGTVNIRESDGRERPYAFVDDAAGLVSLVQNGVLELHCFGARADRVESPDRIVFDLDPGSGVGWSRLCEASREVRGVLDAIGLESWVKLSGGKGIHVVIPISRRSSWAQVGRFARALAERLARAYPDRYLSKASKAARDGRIFIDWLRNTRGATAVAPWSTRAREGAPVALPVGWDELDGLGSADRFGIRVAMELQRRRRKDPWRGMLESAQPLRATMTTALER